MRTVRIAAAAAAAVLATAACSGDGADTTVPATQAPTTTTALSITTEPAGTTSSSTAATTGTTAPETPSTTAPATFAGLSLPDDRGAYFSASGACASCHQQMADTEGNDVSIDAAWRSTMMANAARDPYWAATVRSEVGEFPELADVIEDKCTTCHTPMARTTADFGGATGVALDGGFLDPGNPLHGLGIDGVSCTLCHQVLPDGLGAEPSFSGGFAVDAAAPEGERLAFGPYDSPPGPAGMMQSVSGFIPVRGEHVQGAELCATCHTLYTPTVDAAGEIVGEFAEQTPYLEWEASAFAGVPCQTCHMPEASGPVVLSVTGGPPRSPFSKHHFVGGNAFMLSVLRTLGEEMEVTASSEHFDATIALVETQLAERTATVSIGDTGVAGGVLTTSITVANLTGHKFPTGFPSRRAWLHVRVRDGAGAILFESGAPTPDGAITGNDNDADPAAFEPHYERITDPDEVQIFEPIVADTDGAVTTTLLRGAGYLKDNRLLPSGFDAAAASPDVLPHGAAATDPDFEGGGDTIVYEVDLNGAAGPFTVEATLLYQAIGFRWAENLLAADGAEIAAFAAALDTVANRPLVVGTDTAEAG